MIKIIFLDIDGTLINYKQEISNRTIEAIHEVKKKGYLLSICTGRALDTIPSFLKELPFDGIIASAGAHAVWKGQILFRDQMSQDLLSRTIDVLEAHHAHYILDGRNGKFANEESINQFRTLLSDKGIDDSDFAIQKVEDPRTIEGVESGMYYHADIDVKSMGMAVPEGIQITPMSFADRNQFNGEFTQKGIHKASAILKVITHLGIQQDEVMAIGDGPNDREMLMFAGTSVAMGNAEQETKKLASYVTQSVDQDGVYHAFKAFNLID